MRYLVDTCVVSEFSRQRPDAQVLKWFSAHQQADEFYISAVSIGELQQGIAAMPDGDLRKDRLMQWLQFRILPAFKGHVLVYDERIALKWGDIMGSARRAGRTRPDLDAQIAATAVEFDLTILTRNVGDMAYTGARVCNPFDAASFTDR